MGCGHVPLISNDCLTPNLKEIKSAQKIEQFRITCEVNLSKD